MGQAERIFTPLITTLHSPTSSVASECTKDLICFEERSRATRGSPARQRPAPESGAKRGRVVRPAAPAQPDAPLPQPSGKYAPAPSLTDVNSLQRFGSFNFAEADISAATKRVNSPMSCWHGSLLQGSHVRVVLLHTNHRPRVLHCAAFRLRAFVPLWNEPCTHALKSACESRKTLQHIRHFIRYEDRVMVPEKRECFPVRRFRRCFPSTRESAAEICR